MISVNGYYDGHNYIIEGNVAVRPNQRVIITFLDEDFDANSQQNAAEQKLDRAKIRLLEEISANAHAALNTMQYDGWILRFSGGYTNRANSVSVIYPSSLGFEGKVAYCEQAYKNQHLPCVFKITEADSALDDFLASRGYSLVTPTDVMLADLHSRNFPQNEISAQARCVFTDEPSEEWLRSYFDFHGLTDAASQEIFRRMLAKVQIPAAYCLLLNENQIVACASSALERGFALVQNVAVSPQFRGRGFGRMICEAVLAKSKSDGAARAFLQVVQDNHIALSLYKSLGFEREYIYWYRKMGEGK